MTVRVVSSGDPEPATIAFAAWLATAAKGESYVYHRGRLGDHERWTMTTAFDPTLTIYVQRVGGAAHKAYLDGLVHLFQRADGTEINDYLAVRR